MTEWRSEQEVLDAADRAARAIIDLLNSEGLEHSPGSPEIPGSGGDFLVRGIRQDAMDVLSLDPQKIVDELERMQRVGRDMSRTGSTEIVDALRTMDYSIQDWQGKGAEAFRRQISRIDTFIDRQYEYVLHTGETLVPLLAAAVKVRADYCALAEATISAVQKALRQEQEADTKFVIGLGTTLGSALLSVMSGGAWLTVSAGAIITTAGAGLQRAVEGDKSEDIAEGYAKVRTELLENYKTVVIDARNTLEKARSDLLAEKSELFAPIPASIDVRDPGFHYAGFASAISGLGSFGERVDREHRKLLEQKDHSTAGPNGTIQRRLEGP